MNFGNEIKTLRQARGMTQAQIADALDMTVSELLGEQVSTPNEALPVSLLKAGERLNLSLEDMQMLARIQVHGKRPQTSVQWRQLWAFLCKLVGED